MVKLDFFLAVERILKTDSRFDLDAYLFLKDSLDTITAEGKKSDGRKHKPRLTGHVTAHQLLNGIRLHALKQFGPMVCTVFAYWGVTKCEDFGEMVYKLIELGTFGKSETDSIEDFKGAYTFEDAFVTPFLPKPNPAKESAAAAAPARTRKRKIKSEQGF